MPRVRKIKRHLPQSQKNYYIVDANFLANKYIPHTIVPSSFEKKDRDEQVRRIKTCLEWWKEIDQQLKRDRARVYIPDICIAEAFKVLAKKRFGKTRWFVKDSAYRKALDNFKDQISISHKELTKKGRKIYYHDISTSRDIIISVDRFYQLYVYYYPSVSLADLIIVATAKYLMDFYDLSKERIHIITLDKDLRKGTRRLSELPYVYDPTQEADAAKRIFMD